MMDGDFSHLSQLNQVIMKTRIFAILAGALMANLLPAAEPSVGEPAPNFTAKGIDGKTYQLEDFRGKIVVLEAINLDCPFSLHQYKSGAMPELQAEAAKKGVVWFVVNSVNAQNPSHRSPADARNEFAGYKMKATAWIDDSSGALGKEFGMRTTPHLFVIDPKGILVYQGAIDDRPATDGDPRTARNYVREAIQAITAGQPVKVTHTKPYGCGVKY
jgi:alkyl hydroperoxide reductase subunit AhpC